MIVKMTILRLLGSSDDKEKEKIGIARPEGLPLCSRDDVKSPEEVSSAPVQPTGHRCLPPV